MIMLAIGRGPLLSPPRRDGLVHSQLVGSFLLVCMKRRLQHSTLREYSVPGHYWRIEMWSVDEDHGTYTMLEYDVNWRHSVQQECI
jgi:hypothetical protein